MVDDGSAGARQGPGRAARASLAVNAVQFGHGCWLAVAPDRACKLRCAIPADLRERRRAGARRSRANTTRSESRSARKSARSPRAALCLSLGSRSALPTALRAARTREAWTSDSTTPLLLRLLLAPSRPPAVAAQRRKSNGAHCCGDHMRLESHASELAGSGHKEEWKDRCSK